MKKKEKGPYGYLSNLLYIVTEQWRYSKAYIIAAVIYSPMDAVAAVIASFLPKIVLDCIENQSAASQLIIRVGSAALLFAAAKVLSGFLNAYCKNKRIVTEFCYWQPKLYEKAMDMDYHNFVFNSTRVMREKARDSLQKGNGTDMYIEVNIRMFSAFFGFSAFTAIIARCSVWFIPVLIACYSLSAVGWKLLQKFRDKLKDAHAAAILRMRYVSFRSKDFSEAKDIRIYTMQPMLEEKTQTHLSEVTELLKRENTGHLYNVLLEDVLKFGISLGAYAYLIYLKLNTDMSIGDFALYFGAITGFGEWLSRLVDMFSELLEGTHYVSDYRSFLDLKDSMKKTGGIPLPAENELPCRIEFKNVSFSYDETKKATIEDFSLTVKPGERVAIVGENGAGKSTLVKLLCGLLLPQSGQILINGRDSRDFNRDDYYRLFATVFQTVNILPASVAKNIALCEEDKIDRERLEKCMRLANIYDKVQSLPDKENTLMVHEIHEGGVSFSGGEQQRLLLARALYKSYAPILILDEPTAALDPIAENDLYRQYSTFAEGKTSFYISHRLSSTRFCDRIILVENGKIAETGTHNELMEKGGKYADLFRLQSRYYEEAAE